MDIQVSMRASINNDGVTVHLQASKDGAPFDGAVRKFATGVLLGKGGKPREDQFNYEIEGKSTRGVLASDGVFVSHGLQMIKANEWPDAMLDEFKSIAARVHGGANEQG